MSCPSCQEGLVLAGEPTGTIEAELRGAYFAPAPKSSLPKDYAVLLLTDAFGLPLKNSKLIADELAKQIECDVWIPDLFDGEALRTSSLRYSMLIQTRRSTYYASGYNEAP